MQLQCCENITMCETEVASGVQRQQNKIRKYKMFFLPLSTTVEAEFVIMWSDSWFFFSWHVKRFFLTVSKPKRIKQILKPQFYFSSTFML